MAIFPFSDQAIFASANAASAGRIVPAAAEEAVSVSAWDTEIETQLRAEMATDSTTVSHAEKLDADVAEQPDTVSHAEAIANIVSVAVGGSDTATAHRETLSPDTWYHMAAGIRPPFFFFAAESKAGIPQGLAALNCRRRYLVRNWCRSRACFPLSLFAPLTLAAADSGQMASIWVPRRVLSGEQLGLPPGQQVVAWVQRG